MGPFDPHVLPVTPPPRARLVVEYIFSVRVTSAAAEAEMIDDVGS